VTPPVRGERLREGGIRVLQPGVGAAGEVNALLAAAIRGEPVRRYLCQIRSHDESFSHWGVQGTGWQTGASAACAVTQFARGEIAQCGVFAAEVLDTVAGMAETAKVGLALGVMDLPIT
jgi:saccharopine dehydrogenase-like NADP-dependent oxidoreductase